MSDATQTSTRRLSALVGTVLLTGGLVAATSVVGAGTARAATPAAAAPSACVQRTDLGAAQAFSEFSLGDARRGQSAGVDNEASGAYGGDATFEHFYNGSFVPSGQTSLVVGGDVSGSLSLGDRSVGTYAGTSTATAADDPTTPTANLTKAASSVDFAAAGRLLTGLSTSRGASPTTAGTSVVVDGTHVTLTGTDPTCDVFNLDPGLFAGTVLIRVDVPVGAATLINVPDASLPVTAFDAFQYWNGDGFEPGGHYGSKNEETLQNAAVLNFPNATTLGFSSAAVATTVLAPSADFTFDDGQVDGAVIASTISGGFESEDTGISDVEVLGFTATNTPTPSTSPSPTVIPAVSAPTSAPAVAVTPTAPAAATSTTATTTSGDVLGLAETRTVTAAAVVPTLPFTGADSVGALMAAGEATLLTGGILAFLGRRRRSA